MRKITENFKIATKAILSNKVRSFLTTLGIIIGVFSVILLIAIGKGAKNQVADQLTSFGTNFIFIVPGKIDVNSPTTFNPAAHLGENTLTDKDASEISNLSEVNYVVPVSLVSGQISYNQKIGLQSFVLATWPDIFALRDMKLKSGRMFNKKDLESKNLVAVLGSNSVKELFGDTDPLGKKINLRNKELEVIGVMDKSPIAFRMFGFDFDSIVYIPFSTAEKIANQPPQIFRIVIQTKSTEDVNKAVDQVKAKMLEMHKGTEDFTVLRQEDILKILDSVLNILTIMLVAIAAISLIVGGIGIMNIMLVSVIERTKEIGLRKAVGATKTDILTQFLIESILLSLLGGFLGTLFAYLVSFLFGRFSTFKPALTLNSILLAFGVALVVGVIFGVIPAIRAARLDPIEALRYE